jgi:hypothetical protein
MICRAAPSADQRHRRQHHHQQAPLTTSSLTVPSERDHFSTLASTAVGGDEPADHDQRRDRTSRPRKRLANTA